MLLEFRRGLEARHGTALWIDGAEHLANRPVLAGGVTPLEDDEQRMTRVGVEHALEVGDAIGVFRRLALQLALAHPQVDARINVVEAKRAFP